MGEVEWADGEGGHRKMLNGRTEHSELGQGMRYYDKSSLYHVLIILMAQRMEPIPRKKIEEVVDIQNNGWLLLGSSTIYSISTLSHT